MSTQAALDLTPAAAPCDLFALGTPRELAASVRRALRLGSQSPELRQRLHLAAHAAGSGERRTYGSQYGASPSARLETVRGHFRTPRGRGPAVKALCDRLPDREPPAFQPTLRERLRWRLAAIYTAEIAERGGETEIDTESGAVPLAVTDYDPKTGLCLLTASGWRYYSRRFGSRPASLAYLCGRDDNGRFAVRVPSTCSRVWEAQQALEPAAVRKARDALRTVLRQGDVYAVQTTRQYDGAGDLPPNHLWDAERRELRHLDPDAAHATLSIPFPVRFYAQTALRMGRTSRRGRGD